MKPIKIDFETAPIPFFIYKRVTVANYREYVCHTLDAGYGYLLREVSICHRYDVYDLADAAGAVRPVINLEFFDNAVNHARQVDPVPSDLLSSYNFSFLSNATYNAPRNGRSVRDNDPTPKNNKILNYYYPDADTLRIDITGQELTTGHFAHWAPKYIDIILKGYYIPSKNLSQWR